MGDIETFCTEGMGPSTGRLSSWYCHYRSEALKRERAGLFW